MVFHASNIKIGITINADFLQSTSTGEVNKGLSLAVMSFATDTWTFHFLIIGFKVKT